jgi:hypothetical protein
MITIRLAVITGCALSMAACGSSSKARTAAASSPLDASLKFATCMRAHGVPTFPDPLPGGGFNIPSTVNAQSAAFAVADRACDGRTT